MTAWPVGGVSVTIIVNALADSGMYFDTLTSIGLGSTAASGGCSDCANCTMAGGVCMSMVFSPLAKREKRGGRHRTPLHHLRAGAQKLNVIPVVPALMVAPPIVSLLPSRPQTW